MTGDGIEVQCSSCGDTVCVIEYVNRYTIECSCEHGSVDIGQAAANTSLFEPISGRWSSVNKQ
jgi:hypothetical protein